MPYFPPLHVPNVGHIFEFIVRPLGLHNSGHTHNIENFIELIGKILWVLIRLLAEEHRWINFTKFSETIFNTVSMLRHSRYNLPVHLDCHVMACEVTALS